MATAVASAASSARSHPPASPFAELLRRSRFATYDPAIRQTYRTPAANAHRGDWGLKRPIALKRRNAFITVKGPFETHAQFIEWNRAEDQVRFTRRVEEMDIKPRLMYGTPWYKSVGNAGFQLLLDSEFCPGEGHELDREAADERQRKNMTLDLAGLGKRGPGMYSPKRGPPNTGTKDSSGLMTENIDAMSTKEFSRYLRRIRKLRPAFAQHLAQQTHLRGKSLYALAQEHEAGHHRKFLQQQLATEFSSLESQKLKIEQQPHPIAGLTYSHPSALDTRLHTKPQPGIVLNPAQHDNGRFSRAAREETYVASFGGIAATLTKSNSGGKRPLLDVGSEAGVEQARIEESIADMRPKRIDLLVPPIVVGRNAQGLEGVRLEAQVTAVDVEFANDNPYEPGSVEYNACPEKAKRAGVRDLGSRPSPLLFSKWSQPVRKGQNLSSKQILSTLQNMITSPVLGGQRRGSSDGSEEGL